MQVHQNPSTVQDKKAGIRRNKVVLNPNKRDMHISVTESFEDIQKLNEKALKILAKRA